MSAQAREQQAAADAQAQTFFAQFSATSVNDSAQQIDRLGAALGFSPNARYLESVIIDQAAAADFRTIDQSLTRFLQTQTALVSRPIEPLPADLAAYLSVYKDRLDKAEQLILESSYPQWEMTLEKMFDPNYPSPGFFNIFYLQKLILLSAIDYHHQGQSAQMLSAMEASWRLNQAIAQRPDLVSQILSSIIVTQQASLLRHFEAIPSRWQSRLASQSPQQSILTGLQFENWLKYKVSQSISSVHRPSETLSSALSSALSGGFSGGFSGWFSMRSYFRLEATKAAITTDAALDLLATTDICSQSQVVVEKKLRELQVDRGKAETAFSSTAIARRWKNAGDRALALELSEHVLIAKQQRAEHGTWPTYLPNLTSQTCPNERWIYEVTEDTMTLSLSKPLITGARVPLKYIAREYIAREYIAEELL